MKLNRPITPRENIRRAVNGAGCWTPSWSEIQSFGPGIVPDVVARGFVFEKNTIDNDIEAGGPDMFGIEWEWVTQVGGSMVRPENPQLIADISKWEETVKFPDINSYAWEDSARENIEYLDNDKPTMVWFFTGFFERLISFMGFENAAIALVDDDQKPHVHALMNRLCKLYEEFFVHFKKYYNADMIYFHDDWGGQHAPFFSVDTVREMLLPYLTRVVASAHELGLLVNFHSCGKIENFVPLMIEAGVDIWSGQMLNDMHAVLEKHAGEILIDINPGIHFDDDLSEEETLDKTKSFLSEYGPYLDSIVFQDLTLLDSPREMVYEHTKKVV